MDDFHAKFSEQSWLISNPPPLLSYTSATKLVCGSDTMETTDHELSREHRLKHAFIEEIEVVHDYFNQIMSG